MFQILFTICVFVNNLRTMEVIFRYREMKQVHTISLHFRQTKKNDWNSPWYFFYPHWAQKCNSYSHFHRYLAKPYYWNMLIFQRMQIPSVLNWTRKHWNKKDLLRKRKRRTAYGMLNQPVSLGDGVPLSFLGGGGGHLGPETGIRHSGTPPPPRRHLGPETTIPSPPPPPVDGQTPVKTWPSLVLRAPAVTNNMWNS